MAFKSLLKLHKSNRNIIKEIDFFGISFPKHLKPQNFQASKAS